MDGHGEDRRMWWQLSHMEAAVLSRMLWVGEPGLALLRSVGLPADSNISIEQVARVVIDRDHQGESLSISGYAQQTLHGTVDVLDTANPVTCGAEDAESVEYFESSLIAAAMRESCEGVVGEKGLQSFLALSCALRRKVIGECAGKITGQESPALRVTVTDGILEFTYTLVRVEAMRVHKTRH